MTSTRSPRVSVYQNERGVARALAQRLADAIAARPRTVLGLPTGRTPVLLYRELALLHQEGRIDFAQVTTFNLDEFFGVAPEDAGSYRQFMEHHLFRRINIPPSRVHFLSGAAPDAAVECARYERAIEEAGGIDIQILGIGTNGHIGFNEPARELQSRTHRVTLKPETRRSNASLFGGDPSRVPEDALSMGMATILGARSLVLIATGKSKASCIERVVNGPITTDLPASFLQLHHDVDIMLDEAAGSKLVPAPNPRPSTADNA